MEDITLTQDQQQALDSMISWYNEKDRPYFILSGYAGTGKTFLINQLAFNSLKLKADQVAFCTPTGKAATVLIQSGVLKASTIHRLIYTPKKVKREKLIDGKIEMVEEVIFIKNDSISQTLKLVVVDEISMVNKEIFDDLLSFNIPILCCGDGAQLPPVNGEYTKLLERPDALLTQIIRQKEGSKIIEIADQIRQGKRLEYGDFGEVKILERSSLTEQDIIEMMLSVDQVLCGKNTTRNYLNDIYRETLGITSVLPVKGEKLICTNNNWMVALDKEENYYLVNGMVGIIEDDMSNTKSRVARISFKVDFLDEFKRDLLVDKGIFETDEYYFDRSHRVGSPKDLEQINRFEFGYAISVHKSQGSQFDSVLVFDESRVCGVDRFKWLYTAATRAKNKLIILR